MIFAFGPPILTILKDYFLKIPAIQFHASKSDMKGFNNIMNIIKNKLTFEIEKYDK